MQYAIIYLGVAGALMIFGIGFFCGRAERSSARLARTWEPTEHGGRPL